jgi:2-C-methyl-D-erythritol 2,4-cyclodiphosphate synthase
MNLRSGLGYDSHRFVRGRPLVLGGVTIPSEKGLAGHSDADALLHAVIDALLGAAGLGDIGAHFPDSDPRYKGADSLALLAATRRLLGTRWTPVNVDATVLTEQPRLGPYKNRMRAKIARVLRIPVESVSVKAKTNEGMGFVGKGEGLAVLATALVHDGRPVRP